MKKVMCLTIVLCFSTALYSMQSPSDQGVASRQFSGLYDEFNMLARKEGVSLDDFVKMTGLVGRLNELMQQLSENSSARLLMTDVNERYLRELQIARAAIEKNLVGGLDYFTRLLRKAKDASEVGLIAHDFNEFISGLADNKPLLRAAGMEELVEQVRSDFYSEAIYSTELFDVISRYTAITPDTDVRILRIFAEKLLDMIKETKDQKNMPLLRSMLADVDGMIARSYRR